MRHYYIVALLCTAALAGCASPQTQPMAEMDGQANSRNPAAAANRHEGISVHGKKAHELMAVMDLAAAADVSQDSCGMGHCYETGTMAIQCKSPNGPHKANDVNCDISAAMNPTKTISIHGAKANRVIHLFEAANALSDEEDPCDMGVCYEVGTMSLECIYPNGPNKHHQFDCDLSALKTTEKTGTETKGTK